MSRHIYIFCFLIITIVILHFVFEVRSMKVLFLIIQQKWAGACFSKVPGTFRARKPSLYLKTETCRTPETCCMKRTSLHIKNMWVKRSCNHKIWDFATIPGAKTFQGLRETRPRNIIFWQLTKLYFYTLIWPFDSLLK